MAFKINNRFRYVVPLFFGVFAIALSPSVFAYDITDRVKKYSDFDEKIDDACRIHCAGNKSKGYLKQVTAQLLGNTQYEVVTHVDLTNKQVTTIQQSNWVVWSFNVNIIAYGTLEASTCDLIVNKIVILNDQLGLQQFAKNEEGKTHRISNCKRFL